MKNPDPKIQFKKIQPGGGGESSIEQIIVI